MLYLMRSKYCNVTYDSVHNIAISSMKRFVDSAIFQSSGLISLISLVAVRTLSKVAVVRCRHSTVGEIHS